MRFVAQFFPAADSVVIIEGGKIRAQGGWEAIKHKASLSISKFNLQHQLGGVVFLTPPPISGRLNAQLRARQEAETDLARKTGDLQLYR